MLIKAYCTYKYTILAIESIYLNGPKTCRNALAVYILKMFIYRYDGLAGISSSAQSLRIAANAGVKVQNIGLLFQYHKSTNGKKKLIIYIL